VANTTGPTRERLFDEALVLVMGSGLESLSMRNLADRLHIKASSLYKHVDGRDRIVAHIQENGLKSCHAALARSRLNRSDFANAYRRWAIDNPHLYAATMRTPLVRSGMDTDVEKQLVTLVMTVINGSHEQARAAWSLVHGFVDLELLGRFPSNARMKKSWDFVLQMLDAL
jgi:AcrR family transcriptional regulator